jgi:hypothetical protein
LEEPILYLGPNPAMTRQNWGFVMTLGLPIVIMHPLKFQQGPYPAWRFRMFLITAWSP